MEIAVSEAKIAPGGISRKSEMQITRELGKKSKICSVQSMTKWLFYMHVELNCLATCVSVCRAVDRITEIKGLRGRYTSKLCHVPINEFVFMFPHAVTTVFSVLLRFDICVTDRSK